MLRIALAAAFFSLSFSFPCWDQSGTRGRLRHLLLDRFCCRQPSRQPCPLCRSQHRHRYYQRCHPHFGESPSISIIAAKEASFPGGSVCYAWSDSSNLVFVSTQMCAGSSRCRVAEHFPGCWSPCWRSWLRPCRRRSSHSTLSWAAIADVASAACADFWWFDPSGYERLRVPSSRATLWFG